MATPLVVAVVVVAGTVAPVPPLAAGGAAPAAEVGLEEGKTLSDIVGKMGRFWQRKKGE